MGLRARAWIPLRPGRSPLRLGLVATLVTGGSFMLAAPAFAAPGGVRTPADTGSSLDVAAIAAKVDPAIVDVNTTLANGAAAGTGMIIRSSGEVLTNNHVINGATSVSVQVGGTGATYPAKVVGYDATNDVAVLQIEGASSFQPSRPARPRRALASRSSRSATPWAAAARRPLPRERSPR